MCELAYLTASYLAAAIFLHRTPTASAAFLDHKWMNPKKGPCAQVDKLKVNSKGETKLPTEFHRL